MKKLFIEAFVVGLILLIVSIPIMGTLHAFYPEDYAGCENLPNKSKKKYYVTTLIIGILVHLMCEAIGLNGWYCRYGNACNVEISNPASWQLS